MQTEIIYLIVGLLIGAIAAWIIAILIAKSKTISKVEFDPLTRKKICEGKRRSLCLLKFHPL